MTVKSALQSIAIRLPIVGQIQSRYPVFSSRVPTDALLYIGLFILIAFFKTPTIFKDPRFWAEEGAFYYKYCFDNSFSACMLYVRMGNYQLFTNFIVYISTKVSVFDAPFITTYLSLLLHIVVVVQILAFAKSYHISRISTMLFVASWALLPQTFEVWMTATNVQWVAGVSMLLIVVMPDGWLEQHWKGIVVWAALCGLSGVPAVIVTPIVFLRAIVNRSPRILSIAAILGSTAVLQGLILLMLGTSPLRTYPRNLLSLGVSLLLNTVLSPLFSVDFASTLVQGGRTTLLGLIILGGGIMAIVISNARTCTRNCIIIMSLLAWIIVTSIQIFGGLGPNKVMSVFANSRYFLFGVMCLCVMLAWGTNAKPNYRRRASTYLLLSVAITGVTNTFGNQYVRQYFLNGPSWSRQISACPEDNPCHVSIWPGGVLGAGNEVWALDIIRSPRTGGGEQVEIIK